MKQEPTTCPATPYITGDRPSTFRTNPRTKTTGTTTNDTTNNATESYAPKRPIIGTATQQRPLRVRNNTHTAPILILILRRRQNDIPTTDPASPTIRPTRSHDPCPKRHSHPSVNHSVINSKQRPTNAPPWLPTYRER